MKTVEERVKKILCNQLGLSEVNLEDNLIDKLGADSLDRREIMMESEDEFELFLEDEDFDKVASVQDLVNLIIRNI